MTVVSQRPVALTDGATAHHEFPDTGPWDMPGAMFYWHGPFSSFAALPADGSVRLPVAWYGRPENNADAIAATLEHWFQAAKATSRDDWEWILSAPSALSAKRRGGPHGEHGRRISLRPDWETRKLGVMTHGQIAKFSVEPFRTLLLATGTAVLVEASVYDAVWGGYDRRSGEWSGRNLHGLSLMRARAQLVDAGLRAARTARHHAPYLTTTPTVTERPAKQAARPMPMPTGGIP